MTGVNEEDNGCTGLSLQSGESSSYQQICAVNQSNVPQLQMGRLCDRIQQVPHKFLWVENSGKGTGFPPISPFTQISANRSVDQRVALQNFSTFSSRFSAVDGLPPLIPSHYRDPTGSSFHNAASMEVREGAVNSVWSTSSLSHRRSSSDIPVGFSSSMQPPPPLTLRSPGGLDRFLVRSNSESPPVQMIKVETSLEKAGNNSSSEVMGSKKPEGQMVDDLFTAYMNLDNMDALNSSAINNKHDNQEDLGSRDSASKTNDSNDNEGTSSVNKSGGSLPSRGLPTLSGKWEGFKRNANGDDALPARHYRSASMDSFVGKVNFDDESPEMCLSPTTQSVSLPHAKSLEANDSALNLGFGNGEFTAAELQKIMANEKLVEMACSDPKRVKRILANRQSAARSKERKTRYIAELEHKVQTLQAEASTLATQLTLLRNDSENLTNQNNELKFRLQAMEQQARLHDSLNEALRVEVEHLKLATTESNGDTSKLEQQSLNPRIYQLHQQQQCTQLHIHQLQQQLNNIKNEPEQ